MGSMTYIYKRRDINFHSGKIDRTHCITLRCVSYIELPEKTVGGGGDVEEWVARGDVEVGEMGWDGCRVTFVKSRKLPS